VSNKKYITIITSTLNCASDLLETSRSLRRQTYKNFQWIIIDGQSDNHTMNVIELNKDLISNCISEPDSGIYEAWNKACKLIQGEWVIFLGAGDELYTSDTLEIAVSKLASTAEDVSIAYGDVYQFLGNKIIYHYGKVDLSQWDSYRPKLPAHQGVFHRSTLFHKTKPFDEAYKIVADSKLLILSLREGCAEYLDMNICRMLPGGVSSKYKNAVKVKNEFLLLEKDLGYKIPHLKKIKYLISVYIKLVLAIFK
jgi:glycosyltransferase involved in cell wall biosynthesis